MLLPSCSCQSATCADQRQISDIRYSVQVALTGKKDAYAGDEQFKEEKAVIIKEISSLKPSGGSRGTSPVFVRMSTDGGRTSA